ncbi:cellulase family glycosylhydrolase [Streptomyces sp. NPDC005574]|uniref:glycoside hydrolase 5 family protein n=1 Tax=Streptomyces sp. NPDC005574 TaxID=3156891 RepID=UPI0033BDB2D8
MGAAVGAGSALLLPSGSARAAGASHRPRGDYVTVRKGEFVHAGSRFRFGGTNCYYLHQRSHYMIDSALDDAAAMGLSVVRAWAFADGAEKADRPLQPQPYHYDEDAFDALDYAVHKAAELGIKLVLPLVNNWPDYGGMQQYVKWFLGLDDDSYGAETPHHDRFYTDKAIRACYKAFAAHVIGRRNRYTGLRYHEDPTVMAFELANEPRCRSDRSGNTLVRWAAEMSAHVKRLAPRQLVAVGDEGAYGEAGHADYPYSDHDGVDWRRLSALRTVDYATFHLYPQGWGETSSAKPGTDVGGWGEQWILRHLRDARRLGKPAVLEEFGVRIDAGQDVPDTATRDDIYRRWTRIVERESGAGSQFWLLTSRVDDGSFYPDYDGFRITWNNDDANTTRSTARVLSEHAAAMGR